MRGLERGIERAVGSIRTVAYVEIEAFVVENLVAQMEQGVLAPAPVWTNLKTFPSEQFYRKIHGVTGGYPCQPFSVAGKQRGTDDPRHLWPYIGGSENSIVGSIRPFWCFFENVPGHLNLGYEEVRRNLQGLGYKVKEGIFSAEEVGAPHQRKRLFILGVREDILADSRLFRQEVNEIEATGLEQQSSDMDNACINRFKQNNKVQTRRDSTESASKELADSNEYGERAQPRETTGEGKEIKGKEQWEERDEIQRERMWAESSDKSSNGELANTNKFNTQRNKPSFTHTEIREEQRERSARSQSLCDRGWPARPGQNQYEWEPPRVESKLGYVLNGYNFREDLLRMAGNGVVEQTAEKAWVTLWKDIL